MSASLGDVKRIGGAGESKSLSSTQLFDLSRDAMMCLFQALDLESLLTLARTSKALNEAIQYELLWMELCRPWQDVVSLESWRARVDSGKALYRLLRSFSRFVGAWVHAHIPSNPRGSVIYITWGLDGLEGWQASQLIEGEGEITFSRVFDVQGRPDGSHGLEFIFKADELSAEELRRREDQGLRGCGLAQLGVPFLQPDIELGVDGERPVVDELDFIVGIEVAPDEDPSYVVDPSLQRDIQVEAICGFDYLAERDRHPVVRRFPAHVDDPSLQTDIKVGIDGNPEATCGFDYTGRRNQLTAVGGPTAHVDHPSLQSDDELLLGTQGGTGAVYNRLKVGVPTSEQDLAGLWTGCYGAHGWEILNVTYVDDNRIMATKVTGDPNVPSGAVSFKANLSTLSEDAFEDFEIPAYDDDTNEWTRYPGQGRIAHFQVFEDPRWEDGMLLVDRNRNIKFAWNLFGIINFERISLEAAFRKWSAESRLKAAETS